MTSQSPAASGTKLSRESAKPLYEQIASAIEREIAQGALGARARLASETALMRRFGVSRVTVRGAIARLARNGIVETRQGKGTFVAARVVRHGLDRLTGFYDAMLSQGLRPKRELIDFRPARPAETAHTPFASRVPPPMRLMGLYVLDGKPFAVVCGLLLPEATRLTRKDATAHTIYELLASLRLEVEHADIGIRARPPGADVARRLGLPARRPVLVIERSSFGTGDTPLEHSLFFITPDAYEFRLSVTGPVAISSGIRRLDSATSAAGSAVALAD